jgi:hypothetical protein
MMVSSAAAYYPLLIWVDAPPSQPESVSDRVCERILAQGILVRVFRDGLFAFDFSKWAPSQSASNTLTDADILRRVELLHAHLVCLYTAILRTDSWGPQGWVIVSAADPIFVQSIDDYEGLARIRRPLLPYLDRISASLPAIQASFDLLNTMLQQPTDLIQIADLYLRVNRAFQVFDYNLCLATGWTLSEKILLELWLGYLQSIGKATKSALKCSAADVTKKLRQANRIPADLCRSLDGVRKARNDWLHSLKRATVDDARIAAVLAKQMILHTYNINLEIGLFQVSHY